MNSRMNYGEPGSVARAFLAWRTTATAMLLLWIPLPLLGPQTLKSTEGFQDLAFVILTVIAYAVGVLAVLPLFVFTLGRWLDRRTAPRGLGHSVFIFAIYGLGFGIALALLLGLGGVTPVGTAALMAVPLLSAVAGRLLVELDGRAWFYVFWVTFTLAMMAALAVFVPVVFSGVGG